MCTLPSYFNEVQLAAIHAAVGTGPDAVEDVIHGLILEAVQAAIASGEQNVLAVAAVIAAEASFAFEDAGATPEEDEAAFTLHFDLVGLHSESWFPNLLPTHPSNGTPLPGFEVGQLL